MYLSELINALKAKHEEYGDIQVVTSSDYGDITHTEQIDYIESIEVSKLVKSAYSNSGWAFPDEYIEDERPEDISDEECLVLRHTF